MLAANTSDADALARRLEGLAVVDHARTLDDFVPADQAEKLEILPEVDFWRSPTLETPLRPGAHSVREQKRALGRLPGRLERLQALGLLLILLSNLLVLPALLPLFGRGRAANAEKLPIPPLPTAEPRDETGETGVAAREDAPEMVTLGLRGFHRDGDGASLRQTARTGGGKRRTVRPVAPLPRGPASRAAYAASGRLARIASARRRSGRSGGGAPIAPGG